VGARATVPALIALATAAAGCGSSTPRAATAPPAQAGPAGRPGVALSLLGGTPSGRITACGFTGDYRDYDLGGFVAYRGRVTPVPKGRWTVKVKMKRCTPHGFSETFYEIVRGRTDGTFSGKVPKINPNEFYVRADYTGARGVMRSREAFFRTRRPR
jgi:hypothetical protein